MRAPDAERIKAACRQAVPRLCAAWGWPAPLRIVEDDQGWVNPCFFVDDFRVFRFNARDPSVPKFQREALAYELLAGHGLPVPRVLRLDTDRSLVPWDVLVTEKLPGLAIEPVWKALEPALRRDLAHEAGVLLARIHQLPLEGGFGELVAPPESRHARWSECFHGRCQEQLEEVVRLGVFDAVEAGRFRRVLEGREALLDTVTRPGLVHDDYHFSNLLFHDGRLSGVLDFEWCFAGDPEMDLTNLHIMDRYAPGGREPLEQGYGGLRETSPELGRKTPLYHCLGNLQLCVVSELHLSREEAREAREAALSQLERLESGAADGRG